MLLWNTTNIAPKLSIWKELSRVGCICASKMDCPTDSWSALYIRYIRQFDLSISWFLMLSLDSVKSFPPPDKSLEL